jgi:hypothetical protein
MSPGHVLQMSPVHVLQIVLFWVQSMFYKLVQSRFYKSSPGFTTCQFFVITVQFSVITVQKSVTNWFDWWKNIAMIKSTNQFKAI